MIKRKRKCPKRFRKNKTSSLHVSFRDKMRSFGFITETEFKFGAFIIDEAFVDKRLAIEVDGCYWHGCKACGKPAKSKGDKRKETYLTKRHWSVLRFSECLLNKDSEVCLNIIKDFYNNYKSGLVVKYDTSCLNLGE
jgi:very-short-patch-repair endonuclease